MSGWNAKTRIHVLLHHDSSALVSCLQLLRWRATLWQMKLAAAPIPVSMIPIWSSMIWPIWPNLRVTVCVWERERESMHLHSAAARQRCWGYTHSADILRAKHTHQYHHWPKHVRLCMFCTAFPICKWTYTSLTISYHICHDHYIMTMTIPYMSWPSYNDYDYTIYVMTII